MEDPGYSEAGLEGWQQRVVDEKTELDAKRERLISFFSTDEYKALSTEERMRLNKQAFLMEDYSLALAERIEAWG